MFHNYTVHKTARGMSSQKTSTFVVVDSVVSLDAYQSKQLPTCVWLRVQFEVPTITLYS